MPNDAFAQALQYARAVGLTVQPHSGSRPPTHDSTLPPCPLCGAPALAGSAPRHDALRHDCSCLIDAEAAYYPALRRALAARAGLEALRPRLPAGSQNATRADYAGAAVAVALIARGAGRFVYGDVGAGKTHLTAAIALAAAEEGRSVAFWSFNDLLRASRAAVSGDGAAPDVLSCSLLVLDDLAKCKATEYVYELIYGIADARWRAGLDTLYTANHPPAATARAMTPAAMFPDAADREAAAAALASRFSASGTYHVTGNDRRARP